MYLAASTRCFPDVPFMESLQRLSGLEFSSCEIVVGNRPCDLTPEYILSQPKQAVRDCLAFRTIAPSICFFDIEPDDPDYFTKFEACCDLAKQLRIFTISIRSAELGTPYNEEIERLRRANTIGLHMGLLIGLLTQRGRIAESCESVRSLCRSVPELSVTLDPSQFIYNYERPINFDSIIPLVCNVHLRDTTKKAEQVQIGQGTLEYNKLILQLAKNNYRGALCVDLGLLPGISQESELRKMRFLLESLI
ncbi:MAG: sugar phosphate isomerase/epimerase [Thermoguttaceae bacterium]|nr:sugar phosphate isomerase/epimerase [Thermoguttaceae bacterium]